MCSVYRRFVPCFAKIATALNRKTGNGEPLESRLVANTETDAFRDLKKKLVLLPLLALARHVYKNTVDTDACEHQVGCALPKKQR